jgi:peroxiredoxin
MDTIIQIGKPAPDFTLKNLEGESYMLSDFRGKIVILNFWSAECPWSEQTDQTLVGDLQEWGRNVALLYIASNANETWELITQVKKDRNINIILHDLKQDVADLYSAQTTPHIYLIDRDGILRYQGAFDDRTFRQREPNQEYLKAAVSALLTNQDPNPSDTPAYGCTIVRFNIE